MKERRRFKRYGLTLDARLETNDGDRSGANAGFLTINISAGGAYFTTPEPLKQGMEVRIEIILPFNNLKKVRIEKDACVIVTGKVVRSEAAGIAVQFNDDCSIMPVN
jgi:c-di-GMP-binding flagellar brake protein YcgR